MFLLGVVIYGSYNLSQYVAGNEVNKKEADVILDVGHGGRDPGKIGVNKALETDINLEIAKKVRAIMKEKGISVLLTREKDEGLASSSASNKKVEDMKERVKLINEVKPKLTVSIHQNSYQTEDVKGAQVFYYSHSQKGEEMAKILQEAVRKVDSTNKRQAKANDTYYLLKRTEVPTIIVECGFLSNWEEAQKLIDEEYQPQMAAAVCDGILTCLGEDTGEKK